MQQLTTNESKAIEAAKGTTIRMSSIAKFGEQISKCAVIAGLNKITDAKIIPVMRDLITEQFPWCTLMDLERAVVMNTAKELIAESEKDAKAENQPVNHIQIFGELNNGVVCAILKRYYPFRSQARIKAAEISKEGQLALGPAKYDVTDAMWIEMFETDVQRYKAGKWYFNIIAGRIIQWMEETGRLKPDTFPDSQLKSFKSQARKKVLETRKISESRYQAMEEYQKRDIEVDVNVQAKKIIYEAIIKRKLNAAA